MAQIANERLILFNNTDTDIITTIYVEINSNTDLNYCDMYIYNDKDKQNLVLMN